MGRRMYSESQINRMIDSKLNGHDARIPTDLASDDLPNASLIHLEHRSGQSSVVIGDSVYFKKIFGKSIIGEGNITLFNHHIKMDARSGKFSCCFTLVSSSGLVGDSGKTLEQLLGSNNKPISCSGYLRKQDGTEAGVLALDWKGTLAASKLYLSNGASVDFPASEVIRYQDVVESV